MENRLGRPPLAFVTGMRNQVAREAYCPFHSHREIEIVYHPSGRGMTRLGNRREIAFAPSDAVLYPPNEPHDQTMVEEGEDFCIQIAVPIGRKVQPLSTLHVANIASAALADAIKALSRGYSGLSAIEQAILDLRATTVLMELIHTACIENEQGTLTEGERHVVKAERYIAENFGQIGSMNEVASEVGISHDHLRHLFKELRGKSLIRHVNEVRIERAKTLLVQSILPLKQISSLCGFSDEYYFSTVFRSLTGTTPGRHRRHSVNQ